MSLPFGSRVGSPSFLSSPSIEESLQDILLHILIALSDAPQFFSQRNKVFYCLIDAVVSFHIIAGSFESEHIMIAYIIFGKTILVIAPHHGISRMQVFDVGL
jgi:hypothetical protein